LWWTLALARCAKSLLVQQAFSSRSQAAKVLVTSSYTENMSYACSAGHLWLQLGGLQVQSCKLLAMPAYS
jgi:hypothetical protein